MDVSKDSLDVCLLGTPRPQQAKFDNSQSGLQKLLAWCAKHHAPTPSVVLEATGYYSDLAAFSLHTAGLHVHVANPRRIKDYARSLGRRNKTDRLDAQVIANFGATRALPAWQPPTPQQMALRALLRRLHELELLCRAEANRREAATDPLVQKSLSRLRKALQKECATLETQINDLVASSPTRRADVERLCAIEGIGLRSARWLCAELPLHLPNARAAAAWLAVTPRLYQSGSSVRGPAATGHDGNRHLRRVLYMAAVVARQHNPRLKAFADRLAQNGKSTMAILIAILHKLVKISFSLLKNQSAYQPLHNPLKNS